MPGKINRSIKDLRSIFNHCKPCISDQPPAKYALVRIKSLVEGELANSEADEMLTRRRRCFLVSVQQLMVAGCTLWDCRSSQILETLSDHLKYWLHSTYANALLTMHHHFLLCDSLG